PEEQPGNGRERLTGRACGVHESSAIEVIALHLTWAPSHTGVPNASANCRHNSEEQIGLRPAGTERGDAAVSGPEELARVAQPMTERLVRLADVCQMTGQAVDELERRESRSSGSMALQDGSRTFPGSSSVHSSPRIPSSVTRP